MGFDEEENRGGFFVVWG